MHNPYSGHQATDFRFCFHVRAIAHRSLFLPLSMKTLPKIKRLLKGESPFTVFECCSIKEARHSFCELRKKYVHFADMSKWNNPDGKDTSRVYTASTSAVLIKYDTLIVLEGNIPKKDRFQMERHQSFNVPWSNRMMRLSHLSKNPFFLDHVAMANVPTTYASPFFHINLDQIYTLKYDQHPE